MIQNESLVSVCDNTGVKFVKCIKILKFSKKKFAVIGDIIKVSIKKVLSSSKIKKGSIFNALVVRTIYNFNRKNGFFINFNENSVLLLNNKNEIIGNRIFGPVPRELKDNFYISSKLNSLSPFYI